MTIIWNRHKKCIQISANMPIIGLVIPEITSEMLLSKTNAQRGQVLK